MWVKDASGRKCASGLPGANSIVLHLAPPSTRKVFIVSFDTTELARITELDARLELASWSITVSPVPCTASMPSAPDGCNFGVGVTL